MLNQIITLEETSLHKLIIMIIIILFHPGVLLYQDLARIVIKDQVNLTNWEITRSLEEKRSLLTPGMLKETSADPADFQVLDFSGDGVLDLIYSGRHQGHESERVILFQRIDTNYVEIFRAWGRIIDIWRTDIWLPISFRIFHYGCCDERAAILGWMSSRFLFRS